MEPSREIFSFEFKSSKISDLKKHIPTNRKANSIALALFDFDDTLINSGSPQGGFIGGVKWRKIIKTTIDDLRNREKISTMPLFSFLTLYVSMAIKATPVEKSTSQCVEDLKKERFDLRIFTARGIDNWNMHKFNGIEKLTLTQTCDAGISWPLAPENSSLIFCSYKAKHVVLEDLFEKKIINPDQVEILAYVDDRPEAIPEIHKLAKKYQFSFIGLHYTAVQELENDGFDLVKSTLHLINLFSRGVLFNQQEEKAEIDKFTAREISPELLLERTIIELERFFIHNDLNREYKDADEFFEMVSSVALRVFSGSDIL